jgi:hypothetical protein
MGINNNPHVSEKAPVMLKTKCTAKLINAKIPKNFPSKSKCIENVP